MYLIKLWVKTDKILGRKHIKVQKAQRFPNKMTPKRPTARHSIIKMAKIKDKEKLLKTG